MSQIHFCTFWYPTIFHKALNPLDNLSRIKRVRIDDKSNCQYHLKITLEENEDIMVSSKIVCPIGQDNSGKDCSFDVKLIRTTNRRNGFFQYSFDITNIPAGHYQDFKEVLERDVYHIAKEFYHTHEADFQNDSASNAIVTTEDVSINTPDNQFLISFLERFAKLFMGHAHSISDTNKVAQDVQNRINLIEEAILDRPNLSDDVCGILKNQKTRLWKNCTALGRQCENALIEYTYYNTLLSSKYNKSFLPVTQSELRYGETEDKYRKCALNACNSIRFIENIKYKNSNRYQAILRTLLLDVKDISDNVSANTINIETILNSNKKTERISLIVAYGSLVFGILFGVLQFIAETSCLYVCGKVVIFSALAIFGGILIYHIQKKI